jgi:hypothetical protein
MCLGFLCSNPTTVGGGIEQGLLSRVHINESNEGNKAAARVLGYSC